MMLQEELAGPPQASSRIQPMTLRELFGIEHPIIQAPMAGVQGSAMAIAVSNAGGLGSLPCAMLEVERDPRRARDHPGSELSTGEREFLLPSPAATR